MNITGVTPNSPPTKTNKKNTTHLLGSSRFEYAFKLCHLKYVGKPF